MKEKKKFEVACRMGFGSLCMIGMLCFAGCGKQEVTMDHRDEETYNEVNTKADTEQNTEDLKAAVLDSDYDNTEIFQELYNKTSVQQQALDFSGEWQRTNVASGYSGTVVISNQNAEGFDFSGGFFYNAHSGEIEGRAYFVTEDIAIFQYEDEFQSEDVEAEFIAFVKTEDGMQIKTTGTSYELGFGMNVYADGEYTLDEPIYTNADILAETFTEEELSQMKQLLGEEWYEEYFVLPVEEGIITASDCVLADGSAAVFYDVFWPTMGGYEFTMIICEDGSIYYCSGSEPGWQTNVTGAIDFPEYELVEN